MIEIWQTEVYERWFGRLRDARAASRIDARVFRLAQGHFGDAKPVGEGVSELRIDYGPGYRLYVAQRGQMIVVLLCGGDKGTQTRDIAKAKALAKTWTSETWTR